MNTAEKTKKLHKLEFRKIIRGTKEDVFAAWTDPAIMAQWMRNKDTK